MYPREKEIFLLIITICVILGIILIYFFYSILKYHRRDLKDKLEIIYGKDGILEEEKKRIGREIHDGVSSGLAGIKLMVESLEVTTKKNEEKINSISGSLDTSLHNMRNIMNGLMEINIRNRSLPAVLISYFDKHNAGSMYNNLHIEYSIISDLDFTPEQSNHIYRIIQEVIANTHKHAAATVLQIIAQDIGENTEILFRDNGDGFDINQIYTSKSGIGLNNIKFRTGILNGTCHINSEINKGTEIIIKIPK